MKIYYEPNLYGFVFQDEIPGRNMNFRLKKQMVHILYFTFPVVNFMLPWVCILIIGLMFHLIMTLQWETIMDHNGLVQE